MTDTRTLPLTSTAELIGVKPGTLRRWSDYHSNSLSPGANPLAGQARRFTYRDVEILKYVAELRLQGLTVGGINARLADLTFPEVEENEFPEQVDDSTELASVSAQEGLDTTPAPIVAPEYLLAIERRFEALEATTAAKRAGWERDALIYILGLTSGLLLLAGALAGLAAWGSR